MAVRRASQKDQSKEADTVNDLVEQGVVAFAEQLGTMVGTVQTRAEGWLDRKTLVSELNRIRDNAAAILAQMNRRVTARRKAAPKKTAAAKRPSRGPVDAPGKHHRKPPPQERLDKRMGEPQGKNMGQKSAKIGRQGGRG